MKKEITLTINSKYCAIRNRWFKLNDESLVKSLSLSKEICRNTRLGPCMSVSSAIFEPMAANRRQSRACDAIKLRKSLGNARLRDVTRKHKPTYAILCCAPAYGTQECCTTVSLERSVRWFHSSKSVLMWYL